MLARPLYGPDVEARLAAVLLAAETAVESKTLDTPDAALDVIYPLLAGREEEALVVIAVDRLVRFIDSTVLTIGSSAHTVVDPAQILRWVLTRAQPAHGFVIAHNHPSGDPTPSAQDREVTSRVAAAADAVDLRFLDHLVVTNDRRAWRSFRVEGLLLASR